MNFAPATPPRTQRRQRNANAGSRPKADNRISQHIYAEVDDDQLGPVPTSDTSPPAYEIPVLDGVFANPPSQFSQQFLSRHSTGSSLDPYDGAGDDDRFADLDIVLAAGMKAMAVGGPARCHTPPIYEDFGLEAKAKSFVPRKTFRATGAIVDPRVELKHRLMTIAKDDCGVTCLEPQTTALDKARAIIGAPKTRLQAEAHLHDAGSMNGMFLFRESKGLMVLSLSDGNAIHHLKVESKGVNIPASQFGEDEFQKFVGHYSQPQNTIPAVLTTLLVC